MAITAAEQYLIELINRARLDPLAEQARLRIPSSTAKPVSTLVRPMVCDLHDWMRVERARMSKHNPVAKAINYMCEEDGCWEALTRFLDGVRICLTNNAAERALRRIAVGRKA